MSPYHGELAPWEPAMFRLEERLNARIAELELQIKKLKKEKKDKGPK
jgi:hypothetical protein